MRLDTEDIQSFTHRFELRGNINILQVFKRKSMKIEMFGTGRPAANCVIALSLEPLSNTS